MYFDRSIFNFIPANLIITGEKHFVPALKEHSTQNLLLMLKTKGFFLLVHTFKSFIFGNVPARGTHCNDVRELVKVAV